ncbi:hypothetical protein A0H81_02494 [Grifola frondosa]|uniref:Uncharacterized protein n=1 Tax=Grifola frondosa TaxID=5627 RepID=A0A1C7MKY9_GRIFR|nr:hypothetical protein A0H81_02494 [Grifola frondosa]
MVRYYNYARSLALHAAKLCSSAPCATIRSKRNTKTDAPLNVLNEDIIMQDVIQNRRMLPLANGWTPSDPGVTIAGSLVSLQDLCNAFQSLSLHEPITTVSYPDPTHVALFDVEMRDAEDDIDHPMEDIEEYPTASNTWSTFPSVTPSLTCTISLHTHPHGLRRGIRQRGGDRSCPYSSL